MLISLILKQNLKTKLVRHQDKDSDNGGIQGGKSDNNERSKRRMTTV
jgi:hypothetical protein